MIQLEFVFVQHNNIWSRRFIIFAGESQILFSYYKNRGFEQEACMPVHIVCMQNIVKFYLLAEALARRPPLPSLNTRPHQPLEPATRPTLTPMPTVDQSFVQRGPRLGRSTPRTTSSRIHAQKASQQPL